VKVAELIEALRAFPADMPVMYSSFDPEGRGGAEEIDVGVVVLDDDDVRFAAHVLLRPPPYVPPPVRPKRKRRAS